jgi:uncharacterized protein YwlG (UPF0340 family)
MRSPSWQHPAITRRTALQAGAIGLLGLSTSHVTGLQALGGEKTAKARTVIYTARGQE